LLSPSVASHEAGLQRLDDIEVQFRRHDFSPFSDATTLTFTGYAVFTGEPHLVVFSETGVSDCELAKSIFGSTVPRDTDTWGVCTRVNFGTWLLRRVGAYVNQRMAEVFPAGISVKFARVDAELGAIEYRCYERGINRETLACGTGALSVAYAASALGLAAGGEFNVWPHRCRWYEPDALIRVRQAPAHGWLLEGNPRMLCKGSFLDQDFRSAGAPLWGNPGEGEEAATGDTDDAFASVMPMAS
jgi:diaminopimelate epimerase